ncbi:MAG: acyltransferase family protein [Janthinobacterium lividum]
MHYRKDIQILRGMAVLFVVLFHLQVPGFRAGYLGVDIFFVISGYLMGVMYDSGNKGDFFRKRAARLFPAYFATMLATLFVAAFVTRPDDFSKVTEQVIYGTLFASNIGFWMENSYFDKSSFKPLLHLWSLSIEIQFYLLVPLVSAILRKYRVIGFAAIAASSLGLCLLAVTMAPSVAFYLLPFRLWEFLAGFGIAVWLRGKKAPQAGAAPSCAALLGMLLLACMGPLGSAQNVVTGHPGLAALLVCLATGVLLVLGMPSRLQDNPLAAAFERLGGYSYSVYLAHFPVIVLFLYQPFSGTVLRPENVGSTVLVLLLIVAFSALLFKAVEQPFRQGARAARFTAAAAASGLAAIPVAAHVQASVFPEQERLVYEAWFDRGEFRCGRFYSLLHRSDVSCELTPELRHPVRRVLLVGNSHADAIKGTFLSVARGRNTSVRFVVQNTVLMDGGRVGPQELAKEAVDKRIDAVVLHYSPGAVRPETVGQLARLLAPHGVTLAYLLPIPVWQQSVPKMLIAHMQNGVPLPVVFGHAHDRYEMQFEDALRNTVQPGFRVYRTDQVFCKPVCRMLGENGRPYYFDDAHLTRSGSEQLRPLFEQLFDELPD